MVKNEVFVESPTRIDFAGGTLDCWPINAILDPVTTINVAISIFTRCRLRKREDNKIYIHSREMKKTFEFNNLQDLLSNTDSDFIFFKEHVDFWKPEVGFELFAESESPVGGGLGGSSSLSVSIFKAFSEWMNIAYDEYETVRYCSGIEAKILKTPTGTQDYFPPLGGGINIIDYSKGWPKVTRIPIEKTELAHNIAIFFTGKSHHSGINNWQVMKKFIDGDKKTILALESIQKVANKTRQAVLDAKWEVLPSLFKEEYSARMDLAESFSSPEIEKLAEISLKNGGQAIKICGAGGGGCVFVWSKPSERDAVIKACCAAGFQHLDVHLV